MAGVAIESSRHQAGQGQRHASDVSLIKAILLQLCPRCRKGRIFRSSLLRGFPRMHERCPVCGLKFEREQGYFLGAMYISYAFALVTILVFALALFAFTGWPLDQSLIRAIIFFLPLVIPITLFSRVLWIYLDRSIDPE